MAKANANAEKNKSLWWQKGIRFECQGSGNCCTSHGEYGFVFLTLGDRRRFAKFFKVPTSVFTKKYCERNGNYWHLIERKGEPDCLFLKNKRCSVYAARPTQCRTWPFWPEVMDAKVWTSDVVSFCPGVGKGRVRKADEIQEAIDEQTQAEEQMRFTADLE